jgi:hypothetical protein
MKKLIYTITMGLLCTFSYGQSDVDALRFSQSSFGSSARSMGSAGAFGAVGADISSSIINPAGFAQYKRGEFFVSLATLNAKNTANFQDENEKNSNFSFNVPSFGFINAKRRYVKRKPATTGWINFNYGFTLNRTNSFNRVTSYEGVNTQNSMLDNFAERANGLTTAQIGASDDEFLNGFNDLEAMAWELFLIDSVADKTYAAAIPSNGRAITQKHHVSYKGRTNEYAFNLAANYSNKLYIGGEIHMARSVFKEESKFTEIDDPMNVNNNWNSYTLTRELNTDGYGFGARLGMILRLNNSLRIGAAIQTPTLYSLTDVYSDELDVTYDDGDFEVFSTKQGEYDYSLTTPAKTTLSGVYIFGKKGFISTDIEIADYSTMKLSPSDIFEEANKVIGKKYQNTVNLRVGGEYVMDIFRFRAGMANYQSPLVDVSDKNLSRQYYTLGLGIREQGWGLDIALVQERRNDVLQAYQLNSSEVPYATNKLTNNSLVVTLSTRF